MSSNEVGADRPKENRGTEAKGARLGYKSKGLWGSRLAVTEGRGFFGGALGTQNVSGWNTKRLDVNAAGALQAPLACASTGFATQIPY